MKLEPGKTAYVIDAPVGMLERVALDTGVEKMSRGATRVLLRAVSPEEMWDLQKREDTPHGRPQFYAFGAVQNTVVIWPPPAEAWDMMVSYWPPMVTV